MNRPDRDEGLLALVRDVFENSLRRYGYRRVWLELRNAGIVVSAKRVMRLMTRHGLVPLLKRGLCPKSCANVVPPVRGAVISSLP